MNSISLYLRLLQHIRPYWHYFVLSILATVVLAATEPAMPALMQPLLDGSFVEKDPEKIFWTPILLVLLFLIRGLSTLFSSVAMEMVATRVVFDLRGRMFAKLFTLPIPYLDDESAGVLLSKITFNVEQLTNVATRTLVTIVRDSLSIIGLLAWVLYLNWKLALIIIMLAPVVAFLVRIVSSRIRRLNHEVQHSMGEMTHTLDEVISGNKVVRLFGAESFEQKRFTDISNHLRRLRIKLVIASLLNVQVIQLLTVSALGLIAYLAAHADFSVGEFVSFFGAMALILSPLKRLTGVNAELQRGLAAADTVFSLLDQPDETDTGNKTLPKPIVGELRVQNLAFTYRRDGRKVLEDINFQIQPGETVALVGPSGSGKSTLVALLARFYDRQEGQILLDGVDTRDLPLKTLRSQISLVSQEVKLFSGTIRDNIVYGNDDNLSDREVLQAAQDANALEFIEQLPEGFDTLIGDNGVKLSGGQRQRIAIARALLKNAPILILDEATSALDSESEKLIQEALDRLKANRTSLVIAHRLSTIEQADTILVLDKGRIVERGRHNELINKQGLYQRLHQLQYGE